METKPILSIGITTRNRLGSLKRCLSSLAAFSGYPIEVTVLDDDSNPPVDLVEVRSMALGMPVQVIRHPSNLGNIVGRNRLMALARSDFVLLLDDDTRVTNLESVWEALKTLQSDPGFAVIAFAQLEENGNPWPCRMQPAPVDYPCWIPAFIGFAHLLRRQTFMKLGGYREILHYYGEEKEYCWRLLDAGHMVVYLPQCGVVHSPDPSGRDPLRYYRYYTRNDCLNALLNLPWPLAIGLVGMRLLGYNRTLWHHMKLRDIPGRRWLVRELRTAWSEIVEKRRAVRWQTVRLWQSLKAERPRVSTNG